MTMREWLVDEVQKLERALEIAKGALGEVMGSECNDTYYGRVCRTALAEIAEVMQDKDVDAPT